MQNLVITIIAIAMFGLALVSGANYLNFNSIQAARHASKINSGLVSVSSSIAQYRMLEDEMPNDFYDLTSAGYMKFIPDMAGNINWPAVNQMNFNNSTGALYVCLGGTQINDVDYYVMTRVEENLGFDAVAIGKSCFLTANEDITDPFPTTVWLTYRIQ
jgi:hypothetical protein